MNILTFDIEEWYIEAHFNGGRLEKYKEYDRYLDEILNLLDDRGLKGTFFCVGGLAREFPEVVNRIADCGHEIGCHSDSHTWLNKMTPEECFADTRRAVDSLEQCIGKKVKSYRAPAFSIGEKNKWAFEVLAECGIERDASIFPAVRDFGGFAGFPAEKPCIVKVGDATLKEFPVSLTTFAGRQMAYSGGGYFRFFPLSYIKQTMQKADYSMTYFHIYDLMPETGGVMSKEVYEDYFKEPGTVKARYVRYLKSNLGRRGAFGKLKNLLGTTDFVNIEQADCRMDWGKAPIVGL